MSGQLQMAPMVLTTVLLVTNLAARNQRNLALVGVDSRGTKTISSRTVTVWTRSL